MDKQPATLIYQNYYPELPLGINQELSTLIARTSVPYLSPLRVTGTVNGPWGFPWTMTGLLLQTCDLKIVTAPEPTHKSGREKGDAHTLYTAGQYAVGSAPTKGVFTGVEEAC